MSANSVEANSGKGTGFAPPLNVTNSLSEFADSEVTSPRVNSDNEAGEVVTFAPVDKNRGQASGNEDEMTKLDERETHASKMILMTDDGY